MPIGCYFESSTIYANVRRQYSNWGCTLSQVTYGLGLVAGTLVAGRLVDRYRRVCTQLYLRGGGLWFAALLTAVTPVLFASIRSFLVR